MTLAMMRKLPKRSQGPKKNPASKLKNALRTYINRCPHPSMTSSTKRVGVLLVDWYMTGKRYARASIGTIADELSMGHATVSRAFKTLHDLELVFIKSGGPARGRGFGAIANEFVPNFRLVVNPDTGAIIRNGNYDFSTQNRQTSAESFPHFEEVNSYPHNEGRSNPENRQTSAESFPHFEEPYSDTVGAGATASPPSADAAVGSTSASPQVDDSENHPGPDTPFPKTDGKTVFVAFVRCRDLVSNLDVEPKELKAAIRGKGPVETLLALDSLCKYNLFHFGQPRHFIFESQLPDDCCTFGHTIVYGDEGRVSFVNAEWPRLSFDDITMSSWLAIEYRVSSAYQAEVAAKVKAIQDGDLTWV
jgi:hypothetical protein